jgi:hypothetical protein
VKTLLVQVLPASHHLSPRSGMQSGMLHEDTLDKAVCCVQLPSLQSPSRCSCRCSRSQRVQVAHYPVDVLKCQVAHKRPTAGDFCVSYVASHAAMDASGNITSVWSRQRSAAHVSPVNLLGRLCNCGEAACSTAPAAQLWHGDADKCMHHMQHLQPPASCFPVWTCWQVLESWS